MNNAIIFIRSKEEAELACGELLGKTLLERTVDEIRKTGIEKIWLVGGEDIEIGDVTKVSDVREIVGLDQDGKCLLTTPFYPLINKDDYEKVLAVEEGGAVVSDGENVFDIFMVPARDLKDFEKIPYTSVMIDKDRVLKIGDEDFEVIEEEDVKEEVYRPRDEMNDIKVFGLTSSIEIVEEVCERLGIEPGKISVAHFADGETLVEIGESVRGKRVFVIQSTCAPVNERLMELLIALNALKLSSAQAIYAIIPYFGYARQDRKAKPRQPITAKLVADLIGTAGAERVVTFDLHAAQIQGFFNCPVDDLTTIPMLGKYFIDNGYTFENTVVVSPDHGGVKRARTMAEILGTPIAIIDKRRPKPNEVEATTIIGSVEGMNCIIVDDICDTGKSLVAAATLLKENGAKEIIVALAHGVFSGNAMERLEDSVIEKVVVTNTIPLSDKNKGKTSKIIILSIGYMISELIKAVTYHTPVSNVYNLFTPNKK